MKNDKLVISSTFNMLHISLTLHQRYKSMQFGQ